MQLRASAIAILALVTVVTMSAPAMAGYGALAYDEQTRKQGFASGEDTQKSADQEAVRKCGSENCKVRFGIPPGQCAAFATPADGPSWGGAVRKSAAAATSAAVQNCQKHAKDKCTIRESQCNK
jgi:hypothetical protein